MKNEDNNGKWKQKKRRDNEREKYEINESMCQLFEKEKPISIIMTKCREKIGEKSKAMRKKLKKMWNNEIIKCRC